MAKSVYQDRLIIEANERRTLLNFESFFSTSVFVVCIPLGDDLTCNLLLKRSLATLPVVSRRGKEAIAM